MKFWILTLELILFTTNLLGQTCIQGDCQNGYGIEAYGSNSKYLGEFRNGKKNGQGVFYYQENVKYVGSWKNDTRYGEGRMYVNGSVTQEGTWVNNKLGISRHAVGCISGDCHNGIGIYLYEDGRKIYGKFANGTVQENTICYYPNGDKYIGGWVNNQRNGTGTLYHQGKEETGFWNSSKFVGDIKNGKKGCISGNCSNGEGIYIYNDETRYNGKFDNNLASGFGVCYYADGDIYIGEWKNHTFNGTGTMYFNDGSRLEGVWKNGIFQYKETQTTTNSEAHYDFKTEEKTEKVESKLWIILVGIGSYTTMPSLKYTDDDAFLLHSYFKSPAGGALPDSQIKILIDEDATKAKIMASLTDFGAKAGKNDMLMFFFSGHGMSGSFLPYDYDGAYQVLKHSDILNILESSQAKSKVVIADACHSGSFTAKGSTSYESTLNNLYSAFNNSRGGTLLLLSSKAEEVSVESNGFRQGVFSHYLITGLKGEANTNHDNIVTVEEVYNYVYRNVRLFTNNQQTPVIRGNFDEKMPLGSIQSW
jgi:hypothetical protein